METENEKIDIIRENTIEDCRILYERPCSWECGHGWFEELSRLSYELEALNLIYYPKYRIKIVAEQIKEKFGTLRFYYAVIPCQPKFVTFFGDMVEWAILKMKKVKIDADYIKTQDDKTTMCFSMSENIEDLPKMYGVNNRNKVKLDDVEYNTISSFTTVLGKFKRKPKNHWMLFHLTNMMEWFLRIIRKMQPILDETTEQRALSSYLVEKCSSLVEEAEHNLYNTCESCGKKIDDTTRCETNGWISYVCEDCAKKQKTPYNMNGKEYNNGK